MVRSHQVDDLLDGDLTSVIVFSIAWGILLLSIILIYFLYLLSVRRESEDSNETFFNVFESCIRGIVRNNKINTHLQLHGNQKSESENKSLSSRKEDSLKQSGRSWSLSAFFVGSSSQKSSPRITPFMMRPPSFISARHTSSTLPTNATSRASVQSFASFDNTIHHTVHHNYHKTVRAIVPEAPDKTTILFQQKPRKMVYFTRTCTLSDESCGDDCQTTTQVYRERRKLIENNNNYNNKDNCIHKRDYNEFDLSYRLDILPSIIESQTMSMRDEFTPSNRTIEHFTNQQNQFLRPQGLRIPSDIRGGNSIDTEECIRPVDILLPLFPPFESPINEGRHYMEIDLPEEEYYLNDDDDEEADARSIPLD